MDTRDNNIFTDENQAQVKRLYAYYEKLKEKQAA